MMMYVYHCTRKSNTALLRATRYETVISTGGGAFCRRSGETCNSTRRKDYTALIARAID
jgi:hypothetical protein